MAVLGAVLGVLGLAASGPLVATLLIGRSGPVPSARWAGVTLAVWLVTGGLAGGVTGQVRPVWRRLAPLAPTGLLAPLLVAAYLDDGAYHQALLGVPALLGLGASLLLIGLAWQVLPVGEWLVAPAGARESGLAQAITAPFVLAPLAGLTLMVGLNDMVLEELGGQARVASPVGPLAVLALAPATTVRFWRPLSTAGAALLGGLLVAGFVCATTLLDRFGLAAREAVAAVPLLTSWVPLLGLVILGAALAVRAALPGHASRRAAMGGMREA